MAISVVDPVSPAIERVKKVLFRPFDLGKWFILGFCAFLAQLGEAGGGGGGGGNFTPPGGGGGGGGPGDEEIKQAVQWVQDNLPLVLGGVAAVLLVALVLALVVQWLGARGTFMFLDGVVRNRAAVVEPWHEYRREGNSLFLFRAVLSLVMFLAVVFVVGGGIYVAWPDIQAAKFGNSALLAVLVGSPLLLLITLLAALIQLFLTDFVAPIMYLRRLSATEAWGVFRREILAGNGGTFVLYVLFKIVIGMVVGFIAAGITCITCCLPMVPYLGSVLLLPLLVFLRSYPLYFLEQFGPGWRFFPDERLAFEPGFLEERREEEGPPDDRFSGGAPTGIQP